MHRHTISFPPDQLDLEHVARLFRALADETRVQILLLLTDGEHSVSDLVNRIGAPQSTVSRHLAILRSAHLVSTEREGTTIRYRLGDSHVGDLILEAFSHAEHARLHLPDHPERRRQKRAVSTKKTAHE